MSKRSEGWIALLKRVQGALGLLVLFVAAILFSPKAADGTTIFLQMGNMTDILRTMAVVGIMAVAATYVILTAGIDLSVGSLMALATCVLAKVLTQWNPGWPYGLHITAAVGAAILAAGLAGMLSGWVIARLAVPPFIVTLAAMIGVRGAAKLLTNNATLDIGFGDDAAAVFAKGVSQKPVMIGTFVVLAVVFAWILGKTVFGRYVRAVGDNEKAARYSGLPIRSTKVWVYALSGLMAGVAGVLYAAQTNQGDPNAGMGYELDVIAAVVIGGTSLAGGRGSVVGTLVGTLIVGILTNILGLNNVDSNIQMMVKAFIIVLAVWIQRRDNAD